MTPQEFETYRLENHLTRQALADLIGIPYITYYGFAKRNKKPQLSTFKKLEKFYKENIKKKELGFVDYFDELLEPTPVKIERQPKTQVVYLESVEDVINELKSDNEIHIESSTGHSIKLVDGFVIRYSSGEAISINAPILCSERYYVIKPIPLNLEVGKRYIARNGSVVTIFNVDGHRFQGVIDGESGIVGFYPNGASYNNTDFDLVEEK